MNLTSGSASRMIDRLERAGCVRRVPDPHDRRRPVEEAVRRVGGRYDSLDERHRRDVEDLDADQRAALLRFLEPAARRTEEEIRAFRDR